MTPGARVQAAIEVLGAVAGGAPAERELTSWGRRSRYAGSKDRAAVRDHVYDALRRLRSSAWLGGLGDVAGLDAVAEPARVLAGSIRGSGGDPAALFTGQGHAPPPIDLPVAPGPMPDGVAADLPDWALARLRADHGDRANAIAAALRDRAPVVLRANLARTSRGALLAELSEMGHAAAAHPMSPTAIRLEGNPRGLAASAPFLAGHFEFQDAGSQAVVDRLPPDGERILDLCAGGGGKALALGARRACRIMAHDVSPARMRDIPARAARAGLAIETIRDPEALAPFDGVIADVPCSGSGSWRRSPEARWRLDEDDLADLLAVQDAVLDRALALVRPGGWVAYVTCSLFEAENVGRVARVLDGPGVTLERRWASTPLDDCDGFHLSVLRRA